MNRCPLLPALILLGGCAPHRDPQPSQHRDTSHPAASRPAVALSDDLIRFRSLATADDATWRRLDMAYLQMQAALGGNFVRDLDYPDFVRQLDSPDPDTRANGMSGLAASKSAAAVDHLTRALNKEPDPFNRTIAVWCLRYCGGKRAAAALFKFLSECRDIDLGRAIDLDGQVKDFRSPFPVAGMETFKALVALRGKKEMFEGAGWDAFVQRTRISVHPEPVSVLNVERLKGHPGEPRTDPAANMRKWLDEMRQ